MNDQSHNFAEQGAVFQKIWIETMSKLMQTAFTFSPNSTPPELLREIRDGILKALGESWNEFLRSPQFQQNMKQWMENAVAVREMSNDFMGKVRKEMQAPSRDDIDAIMLNVRHLETRILDRLETLSKEVESLKGQGPAKTPAAAAKRRKASPRRKTGTGTNHLTEAR
jgi:hypothetical protein